MFKDFHDKYKCIFIHVPKVAGSSIERVIYQTDRWLVGHVKASDYVRLDRDRFENYFSFGFVRNPYDRVVSAYHYLRNGGGNSWDANWAKIHLNKYFSFEDFIMDLHNEKVKDEILNWIHFVPQYKFLCNEQKKILVNFVGKFENLSKDFAKILQILNRNDKLVHINKSKHFNYSNYYNKVTYKVIRDIYKDDFEIFDYDLEEQKIFFHIPYRKYSNLLENKLINKNEIIESLRIDKLINNQKSNHFIQKQISQINNKNKIIISKDKKIFDQNLEICTKNKIISFISKYGTAKSRIQNQLSYKLGQAMIVNSKSILGYLIIPVALLSIIISHKQEQKIYQEKIKKDPSLKLPPLESYPDCKEALKLKNHLSYKLGQALIQANKTWYKGGYVKMLFEIRKLK
ncbi:sulfotransferase family protein, partial [Campylobacter sp. IFREMER_LSEM_CL1890]|uniref:sulfotransferase family protein n=1 Tax=Campylobacter sp. IFREMER_LSEM_CL1890 TaxID=2911615 RepID=UPI0021E64B17